MHLMEVDWLHVYNFYETTISNVSRCVLTNIHAICNINQIKIWCTFKKMHPISDDEDTAG